MSPLTLDSNQVEPFLNVREPVEVRDPSGQPMGVFTPFVRGGREADTIKSEFDLEKARQILARERDQGAPLAQVWERVQARGKSR